MTDLPGRIDPPQAHRAAHERQAQRTEHTLLGTDDAMVWAEEFCRIFAGHVIVNDEFSPAPAGGPVDPGTMVAWFANAMQTAINFAEKRWLHERGELTQTEKFLQGLDQELPDQDELEDGGVTLEEQFLEGFQEGRTDKADGL